MGRTPAEGKIEANPGESSTIETCNNGSHYSKLEEVRELRIDFWLTSTYHRIVIGVKYLDDASLYFYIRILKYHKFCTGPFQKLNMVNV